MFLLWQSIPVAGNGDVAWVSQPEDDLGKAVRVLVAQEERPIAIDPDRILSVVVPIPHDRLIARQAIVEGIIRKTRVVGVLEEDHPVGRAEDAGRIDAIPIPVASHAHIANIPQEEACFCRSCIVAVAQQELSGRGR